MQVRTVTGIMSVRITAKCSFCARPFMPELESGSLTPRADDMDGRLCCPACVCEICGYGHVLETDIDECYGERAFPAGEMDDFDYEAWTDGITAHALVQS